MPRTIEITVSPRGETTLTTRGYAGSACRRASAPYEAALGPVLADRPTAEARLRAAPERALELRPGHG